MISIKGVPAGLRLEMRPRLLAAIRGLQSARQDRGLNAL